MIFYAFVMCFLVRDLLGNNGIGGCFLALCFHDFLTHQMEEHTVYLWPPMLDSYKDLQSRKTGSLTSPVSPLLACLR